MDDRQLIADLLSALEYHTEQTRPIEFSKVAIEAAREYLRKPAQQWSAGVPPLYPEPEPGVSIKAEYEPAQPMHPEIKKTYEDYFDKCFRESSPTQQEPVAWMFQHDETGRMNYVGNDGIHNPTMFLEMNPRYALVCPLYTAPPQRPWVGLTEADWEHIDDKKGTALDTFTQGAVWAEVQLRERNT